MAQKLPRKKWMTSFHMSNNLGCTRRSETGNVTPKDHAVNLEPNHRVLFARLVGERSFSRCRSPRLPKRRFRAGSRPLETQLAEQLLKRTTRKLTVTEFGRTVLELIAVRGSDRGEFRCRVRISELRDAATRAARRSASFARGLYAAPLYVVCHGVRPSLKRSRNRVLCDPPPRRGSLGQ
jgi:hypothetical protein